MTDNVTRKLGIDYKPLIEDSLSLADFKRRFVDIKKEHDIGFHAYIIKVISAKNRSTGELEVMKVLAMTQD